MQVKKFRIESINLELNVLGWINLRFRLRGGKSYEITHLNEGLNFELLELLLFKFRGADSEEMSLNRFVGKDIYIKLDDLNNETTQYLQNGEISFDGENFVNINEEKRKFNKRDKEKFEKRVRRISELLKKGLTEKEIIDNWSVD